MQKYFELNIRKKKKKKKSLLNNMQNSFINKSVLQEKPKMISSFLHLEEFKKEIAYFIYIIYIYVIY